MSTHPLEGLGLDLDLDPTTPNLNTRDLDPNLLHTDTSLQKRYTTISIPSTYGRIDTSPAAGTVVGIVLGSVAGFVLLMYVLFLAVNPGGIARGGVAAPTSSSISMSMSMSMDDEEIVEVRSRRGSSAGGRRHRDVIEVTEERETFRDSYRRRPSSRHDRVVVEESLATSTTGEMDEDIIEVEEEESSVPSDISPRPPRRSRRGGVRHVDPLAYGGGSEYSGRG
ncbi:uncharacterized protein N7500_004512 [Penicillium coprophilum]|uniref:uncharacterized protein n=1 Tax=Penicillium coprophilum TaxID=36646 RepID=UPI00238BAB5D|nr:uncharacterized protein N7500_004512 [Penicillium coprophilum]KAJ5162682.1 hypothetical protein N7500_004512 [Penicillium coprophilum]